MLSTSNPLESARCSVHAARWTLDQAVNFVLSNLELMRGGEIFVPKLEKTSIVQLVRILARREDFPLKITAIRPGERMRPIALSSPCTYAARDAFIHPPDHHHTRVHTRLFGHTQARTHTRTRARTHSRSSP